VKITFLKNVVSGELLKQKVLDALSISSNRTTRESFEKSLIMRIKR